MSWLTGWEHAKEVSLTGQSGAGTLYQVELDIGDSAGGDFHLEGNCLNFPQDIEVTTDDGETLLNFSIEDLTADPLKMWVEVSDDLGSNQKIWVYYGKSGATTNSDIDTTFLLGDDFTGDLSKWTIVVETPTIVNNMLELSASDDEEEILRSDNTYAIGKALRLRQKTSVVAMIAIYGMTNTLPNHDVTDGDGLYLYEYAFAEYYYYTVNNGAFTQTQDAGYHDTNWHVNEFRWRTGNVDVVEDGSVIDTHTTNIPDASLYVYLRSGYPGWPKAGTAYVDWVAVRKYVSPEPAFASAGAEQNAPTDITILDYERATMRGVGRGIGRGIS